MNYLALAAALLVLAGCSSPQDAEGKQPSDPPIEDASRTDDFRLQGDGTLADKPVWGEARQAPFVEGEGVWSIVLDNPKRPTSAAWAVWVQIPANAITMPTEVPCRWSITLVAQVDRTNESNVVTVGEACSRDPGLIEEGPLLLEGGLGGDLLSQLPIEDGTKLSLSITTSIRGIDGAEVALLWGNADHDSHLSLPGIQHVTSA